MMRAASQVVVPCGCVPSCTKAPVPAWRCPPGKTNSDFRVRRSPSTPCAGPAFQASSSKTTTATSVTASSRGTCMLDPNAAASCHQTDVFPRARTAAVPPPPHRVWGGSLLSSPRGWVQRTYCQQSCCLVESGARKAVRVAQSVPKGAAECGLFVLSVWSWRDKWLNLSFI